MQSQSMYVFSIKQIILLEKHKKMVWDDLFRVLGCD